MRRLVLEAFRLRRGDSTGERSKSTGVIIVIFAMIFLAPKDLPGFNVVTRHRSKPASGQALLPVVEGYLINFPNISITLSCSHSSKSERLGHSASPISVKTQSGITTAPQVLCFHQLSVRGAFTSVKGVGFHIERSNSEAIGGGEKGQKLIPSLEIQQ